MEWKKFEAFNERIEGKMILWAGAWRCNW